MSAFQGRRAEPTLPSMAAVEGILLQPLRVLQSELGRRLLAAAALGVALVALVGGLYAHPDAPARADGKAAVARAAAPRPQAAAGARQPRAPAAGVRSAPARQLAAGRPDQAAVAAYAARLNVPVAKVQALQQRQQDANTVQVLVLAEAGGRLRTAWVTANRGTAGWTAR